MLLRCRFRTFWPTCRHRGIGAKLYPAGNGTVDAPAIQLEGNIAVNMVVERLSPVLGAEITGADLSCPLTDDQFAGIRQVWLESDGVLVLRRQELSPDLHIAFSRRFGELERHVLDKYLLPGHPEIYRVSNKVRDGQPLGRANAGTYWHSDLSYVSHPAMASLLYAIEVPPVGGDTLFCNMYAAYDALPDEVKRRIERLTAVHDFGFAARGVFATESPSDEQLAATPAAEHPMVRTHPFDSFLDRHYTNTYKVMCHIS